MILMILSRIDHAGPKFGLAILGFEFNIALFDMRHWDSFDNCWENKE
jgi:hypothetical protein